MKISEWKPRKCPPRPLAHPRRNLRSCCRKMSAASAVLTLNRPAARNSLSEGLIAELHGALRQIHDDNSVRAVVIAANGPAFSAGHDMKELTARRSDADRGRAYFGADHERLQRDDAGGRASAEARGRRRAGHRDRRRLPARRKLRSRGRLRGRRLRHPRRRHRPVLFDADGGAVAQHPAQAGDGDAADRRADFGGDGARISASSTASSPPAPSAMRRSRWRKRSRSNPPTPSSSARRRSIARPK